MPKSLREGFRCNFCFICYFIVRFCDSALISGGDTFTQDRSIAGGLRRQHTDRMIRRKKRQRVLTSWLVWLVRHGRYDTICTTICYKLTRSSPFTHTLTSCPFSLLLLTMATLFHGENQLGRRAIGMKRTFDQLKTFAQRDNKYKTVRKKQLNRLNKKTVRHIERERKQKRKTPKRKAKCETSAELVWIRLGLRRFKGLTWRTRETRKEGGRESERGREVEKEGGRKQMCFECKVMNGNGMPRLGHLITV